MNNNNTIGDVVLFLIDISNNRYDDDINKIQYFFEQHNDDYRILINDINIGLEYIDQSNNNIENKSKLYYIVSILFQLIFDKNKDSFEFNEFISNCYSEQQQQPLVTIINYNILSFLQIYKIILDCKIKYFNILTNENINDIQFFYKVLKTIITKYSKNINRNTVILGLISNIIIEINENSIKYLIKNEQLLTKPISMLFVKILIDDLSMLPIDIGGGCSCNNYDELVCNYIKTIQLFWNGNQLSSIQISIQHMFKKLMLSNNQQQDEQQVTPTISNVLNIAPIELIPLFINIIDNGSVKDVELLETITKLTKWPLTPTNSKWILETFNSLIKSKKTTLLASIVVESALSVIKQMFVLSLLPSSFEILQKMLLGYQHSPDTFHSIIHMFPIIMELLLILNNNISNSSGNNMDESTQNLKIDFINLNTQQTVYKLVNKCNNKKEFLIVSLKNAFQPSRYRNTIKSTLNRFCQLSFTLMYHHTGYPELYAPLLDSLNKCITQTDFIKPPTEFEIKKLLQENEWSSLDSMVFENIKLNRVLTDRAGLINLGNTCYMNSFIQSLYMTIPFRNYLLYNIDQNLIENLTSTISNTNNNDEEIFRLYSKEMLKRPNLLKQIQLLFGYLRLSVKESISPNLFLQSLPNEFQSGQQHDSFEFGKTLLDNLDSIFKQPQKLIKNDNNNNNNNNNDKKKITTEISKIFGGKLSQTTTCRNCKISSTKVEEFLELSLPFHDYNKKEYQLEEMINGYLSNEELVGDNKYHCDNCKSLQNADKIIEINETPNHLIIGLNRFHFSRQSKSIEKLLNYVDYPLNLNLQYIEKQQGEGEKGDKKIDNIDKMEIDNNEIKIKKSIIKLSNYSLYSVIIHSGRSPSHGHYYNYSCNSSNSSSYNNSSDKPMDWCMFNDSMVKISEVKTFKNITKQFYSDVPYILFYVKTTDNGIVNNNNLKVSDDNISNWIKQQVTKENQLLINKYKLNNNNANNNVLEQFHVYGQFNNKKKENDE